MWCRRGAGKAACEERWQLIKWAGHWCSAMIKRFLLFVYTFGALVLVLKTMSRRGVEVSLLPIPAKNHIQCYGNTDALEGFILSSTRPSSNRKVCRAYGRSAKRYIGPYREMNLGQLARAQRGAWVLSRTVCLLKHAALYLHQQDW